MSNDLEALIANANAYKSGASAATQQILALTSQQADLSNADATLLNATAADTSTVQAAAGAAALVTQASRVRVANTFSTNIDATTEQYTQLSQAANQAQIDKDAALKDIQSKDSVSLFDDPIQYFTNQFTVNQDIARHNAADALLESAQNRIDKINSQTESGLRIQNSISEPLTAASAAAATKIAASKALLDANRASQEGLSYNIQGVTAALNTSKEALGVQFQVQSARNTEQQIGISMANLRLSQQEFEFRKDAYLDTRNDKEEQKRIGQSIVDTVNVGRGSQGLAPLTDINGKVLLSQLKVKGWDSLSGDLKLNYDAGLATQTAGIPVIGSSPSRAAQALSTLPVKLNPTQEPVKQILSSASQEVFAQLKKEEIAGGAKKDAAAIQDTYNKLAQAHTDTFAANIKPGDATNPYQIGSINQLAANSPTIQALPVYQKVFDPLVKAGVQLSDPSQIFGAVSDAVTKGTITHNEALELTTIYQVGVKTNLAMRNLPAFGLVPRLSYNTSLETNAGIFNSNKIVDLTKPDALSRALVSRNAAAGQIGLLQNTLNILPGVGGIQAARNLGSEQVIIPDGSVTRTPAQQINNSIFQPQPDAVNSIETKVKSINAAVDNFFGTLPTAAGAQTAAKQQVAPAPKKP